MLAYAAGLRTATSRWLRLLPFGFSPSQNSRLFSGVRDSPASQPGYLMFERGAGGGGSFGIDASPSALLAPHRLLPVAWSSSLPMRNALTAFFPLAVLHVQNQERPTVKTMLAAQHTPPPIADALAQLCTAKLASEGGCKDDGIRYAGHRVLKRRRQKMKKHKLNKFLKRERRKAPHNRSIKLQ